MQRKPTGGTNKHGKHIIAWCRNGERCVRSNRHHGNTSQMVTSKQGLMGIGCNHITTSPLRVLSLAKPRTREANTCIIGWSKPFDVGLGVWTMTKTMGSRSGPSQWTKAQEIKTKRWKGYNSTWHDKHSLGLGTQTWHGVQKHMEDRIKHVENIDPSTQACENIVLDI